jgi:hypothetical protein
MVQDPVWPTAAKERIYRYIHTLNPYQIRSVHDTDLMDLARSFVEVAGLQAAPKVYEQVANASLSSNPLSFLAERKTDRPWEQ